MLILLAKVSQIQVLSCLLCQVKVSLPFICIIVHISPSNRLTVELLDGSINRPIIQQLNFILLECKSVVRQSCALFIISSFSEHFIFSILSRFFKNFLLSIPYSGLTKDTLIVAVPKTSAKT